MSCPRHSGVDHLCWKITAPKNKSNTRKDAYVDHLSSQHGVDVFSKKMTTEETYLKRKTPAVLSKHIAKALLSVLPFLDHHKIQYGLIIVGMDSVGLTNCSLVCFA